MTFPSTSLMGTTLTFGAWLSVAWGVATFGVMFVATTLTEGLGAANVWNFKANYKKSCVYTGEFLHPSILAENRGQKVICTH